MAHIQGCAHLQLHSEVLAKEIAKNKPSVIVVDNDDFQNDTLIGGNTSHNARSEFRESLAVW